jgi:hypothetical protein
MEDKRNMEKFQENDVVPRISFIAHGRGVLFSIKLKPGYLAHTNSYFESEKCMLKMRLKDTQ